MNIFIYDSYLNQKKYNKELIALERKITDLGLNGKIIRLGMLSSLENTVEDELKKRPKTIIVVGGDALVNQVAGLMSGCETPLAVVPMGESNQIANGLGISTKEACAVLLSRRILNFDLGMVDDQPFVKNVVVVGKKISLLIDDKLAVNLENPQLAEVINFSQPSSDELLEGLLLNPADGLFGLLIVKKIKHWFKSELSRSFFACKNIKIQAADGVIVDGFKTMAKAHEIHLLKNRLNIIVGKNRNF